MAIVLERFARLTGCTVRLHYELLYRGVVDVYTGKPDKRGPCGCHLDYRLCQMLWKMSYHEKREWIRMASIVKEEAESKLAAFLEPRKRSVANFSTYGHLWPGQAETLGLASTEPSSRARARSQSLRGSTWDLLQPVGPKADAVGSEAVGRPPVPSRVMTPPPIVPKKPATLPPS